MSQTTDSKEHKHELCYTSYTADAQAIYAVWNFQIYEHDSDILCNLRSYVITHTISPWIYMNLVGDNRKYKSAEFYDSTENLIQRPHNPCKQYSQLSKIIDFHIKTDYTKIRLSWLLIHSISARKMHRPHRLSISLQILTDFPNFFIETFSTSFAPTSLFFVAAHYVQSVIL